MPEHAVYVGRPTRWGNPFRISRSSDYHGLPGSWFLMDEHGAHYHPDEDTERSARRKAVDLYADRIADPAETGLTVELIRAELAGRDLVCWCPAGEPCHADVLLAIGNSGASPGQDTVRRSVRRRTTPEGDQGGRTDQQASGGPA